MTPPTISVCIVTYQARELLVECLRSLAQNTSLDYEVIVVDNGSTDGVEQILREQFPLVHFMRNEQNLGYTRPMNQALEQAKGQFLLQLNPDTLVLSNAVGHPGEFHARAPPGGYLRT